MHLSQRILDTYSWAGANDGNRRASFHVPYACDHVPTVPKVMVPVLPRTTGLHSFHLQPLPSDFMAGLFQRFAEECRLRVSAEPLCIAPRDVLTPLEALEQHFLVELAREESDLDPVRLIFALPATENATPGVRDVLWWLAGDAWALERSDRELESWAAVYGYPPAEEATARLFARQLQQADALSTLLGETNYRRLLAPIDQETTAREGRS